MQWLIDGHNLIGCMPNLHLDDPNDEEKLLEHLRRYRARTGHKLTVVFDAGVSFRPAKTRQRGGITVQFAPQGRTADQIIMRRLRRLKNPQAIMLVTSDRAVQQAAQQARVRVVSSQEFAQQLLQLSSSPGVDEANQTDVALSADEVEEWLEIFNQSRT